MLIKLKYHKNCSLFSGFEKVSLLLTFLLLSSVPPLYASDGYYQQEFELKNENKVVARVFPADGESLILWLPSHRGMGPGLLPVALELADLGHDVWQLDLHETYMVPIGRTSLDDMPIADLREVLSIAVERGFKRVTLAADGRGAQLALKLARDWQLTKKQVEPLNGMLLAYPHLLEVSPEIGEDARYLPVAKTANLPVYYLQPQFSTKYARAEEIAEVLRKGGSEVFIHKLPGVQAGFHARPDEDLTEIDFAARDNLPTYYSRAVKLLAKLPRKPLKTEVPKSDAPVAGGRKIREARLYPFKGEKNPPQLKLPALDGEVVDLESFSGQAVLVNFWATWCGPCVEEIPSLGRLVDKLSGKPFQVLTVNIGEPRDQIEEFLEIHPVNFPVLLDVDGTTVRDWKVYAYPSNFLIDRNGVIRYAYRGALEWDAEEVVDTIKDVILESAPSAYAFRGDSLY